MSEWKEVTLGFVLQDNGYIRGPFGSTLKRGEMRESGIPVYEQKNAIYNTREFRFFIDETKFKELSRFQVRTNDLIISCSGTVGKISIIKESDPKGIISQALLILRPDILKIDPKYLFYFLSSKQGFELITQSSHGSVQVNIAEKKIVQKIPIPLPPLPEQKAIAEVLSSIDDKIELLHRQNKTLEEMAMTLFRQWFIEPTKDGLPDGWEEGKLGDILSIIESGSRPKGGIDPNLKDGIPSIGAENINGLGNYDYSKTKYISKEFYNSMKRGRIQDYDVLIYKDGAYIGKKAMFGKGYPFEKATINEHVFILRGNNKVNQFFLYFLLNQQDLEQLNSNSVQPGLTQEAMKSFEIIIPSFALISRFGELTKPLVDKIFSNAKQIRTLEKLRDTILPKLMNGEVRVKV